MWVATIALTFLLRCLSNFILFTAVVTVVPIGQTSIYIYFPPMANMQKWIVASDDFFVIWKLKNLLILWN